MSDMSPAVLDQPTAPAAPAVPAARPAARNPLVLLLLGLRRLLAAPLAADRAVVGRGEPGEAIGMALLWSVPVLTALVAAVLAVS